jgi:two-component system, NarL family, invasion response regulator UvrY
MMIKILIADDHPIIRQGLKLMISDEDEMRVEGEAENGKQVFELLEKNEYDILVLDLCLPDMNGMEILSRTKKIFPKLPVLILSALPEEPYAINLIKSGASGYVNKIAASDQLVNAIKLVLSGKLYINPEIADKIIPFLQKDNHKILHSCLTDREMEVMCLLASGKTIKNISNKLFISLPTVYKYRTKIFNKMHLKNDSELIQYCMKQGLLLS